MSAPSNAIFLSYASQGADAARKICEALRADGIEVWFDRSELRGGDAWDAKIKKQIQTCALFVPIVSAQTQARTEGYFRLEWLLAAERTRLMGRSKAFLLPVCIDATKEGEADVPESFLSVQWTRLVGGETPSSFVARVGRLLDPDVGSRTRERLEDSERVIEGETRTHSATKRGVPGWMWVVGALGMVAVGLVAFIALRPATSISPNSAAATPSPAAAKPPLDFAIAKSIAVLAFKNLSDDKEAEYFSDGISEELSNVLGRVPGLRVAGSTSAFSFKGKLVPIPEIAQKLGVAYLVEGTVKKSGGRVRITAKLINAADGFQVWASETFDRELKDVWAVQDEIVGLIAQNLQLTLGAASRVAKTVNPEAHRLVLEGRHFWSLRNEGFARAQASFEKALALDPEFAPAHAGLGLVCVTRAVYRNLDGFADIGEDLGQARRNAQRAYALDPTLVEAHAVLGYVTFREGRLVEAEQHFQQALKINPNDAVTHHWHGLLQSELGRLDLALKAIERAIGLDPLSFNATRDHALLLACVSRYGEALAVIERSLALRPEFIQGRGVQAWILLGLGRTDEAVSVARSIRKDFNRVPRWDGDASAIQVLRQANLADEAAAYAAELMAAWPPESRKRRLLLATLGRFDEALMPMKQAPQRGWNGTVYWDVRWDPVREDPRFRRMLVELKCVEEYKVARETLARMLKEQSAKK
ncbi:MAG: TIR domain-containing protein [Verrucomicrobia bacterium]|nr:TIR domain-containing protein [Verrucomicrobiota bacterium]